MYGQLRTWLRSHLQKLCLQIVQCFGPQILLDFISLVQRNLLLLLLTNALRGILPGEKVEAVEEI